MCDFWQTGAETVENVTFGERSLENKVGRAQRLAPNGSSHSEAFDALLV